MAGEVPHNPSPTEVRSMSEEVSKLREQISKLEVDKGKLTHDLANERHNAALARRLEELEERSAERRVHETESVRETGSWGFAKGALGSIGRGGPVLVVMTLIIAGLMLILSLGFSRFNETLLRFVETQSATNELTRKALDELRRK